MSIDDAEDEEMVFVKDVVTKAWLNHPLRLVGRFLTKKIICVHIYGNQSKLKKEREKQNYVEFEAHQRLKEKQRAS